MVGFQSTMMFHQSAFQLLDMYHIYHVFFVNKSDVLSYFGDPPSAHPLSSSDSEVGGVMDAREYLSYEMEFDLNDPYEPTDEEFLDMCSLEHQEVDVDEVMVDVVEEVLGLSVAERSLKTLEKYALNKDQMMPYHTSRTFNDSKKKFHLIIWKLLVGLL